MNLKMSAICWSVLVGIIAAAAGTARGGVNRVIYVDAQSTCMPGSCTSPCTECPPCGCTWATTCGCNWATAFKYLQDALQYVRDNPNTVPESWDEIWVANGVYKPLEGTPCNNPNSCNLTQRCDGSGVDSGSQEVSFCMRNNLRIYGGFIGWEGSLSDRPPDPDPFTIAPSTDSVLSGDYLGDDAIVPDPLSGLCPITTSNPTGSCSDECINRTEPQFPPNTWDPGLSECRDAYGLLVTRRVDNSWSVVSGPANLSGNMDDGSASILDGFSITGGFHPVGPGPCCPEPGCGGMRFLGGSPRVWNCTIKGNRANNGGGGIYAWPLTSFGGHFVNCVIMDNYSNHGGGTGGKQASSPYFVNCYVLGNVSGDYGGAFNFSDPSGQATSRIINCVLAGNKAGPIASGGGGFAGSGGAIYASGTNTLVRVINSVIADNETLKVGSATRYGGGLYFGNSSKGEIANTIVWGNVADEGMQMYVYVLVGRVRVNYSDVRRFTVNQSGVKLDIGGFGCLLTNTKCFVGACADDHSVDCLTNANCTGHIPPLSGPCVQVNLGASPQDDPVFVDPNGLDYTPVNDYLLTKDSPCIDAADNRLVPADEVDLNQDGDIAEKVPLDLDRGLRFINYTENDPDHGQPDLVWIPPYPLIADMGAYEFEGCMTSEDCDSGAFPCKGYKLCIGNDPGNACVSFWDDCDGDGTEDACDPDAPLIPDVDSTGVNKCRFISFSVQHAGSAAIQVRLNLLHHPNPPYGSGPPPSFAAYEGQERWVGPPTQYVESVSSGTPFYASQLQCTPYSHDWSTVGLLHVMGSEIVPSSEYTVKLVPDGGGACSKVIQIRTTRWGDVETPYNPPDPSSQPDFSDIGALVNKFKSAPGAPIKARAFLAGEGARGLINLTPDLGFGHISACVDAFKGLPYPYEPAGCPQP